MMEVPIILKKIIEEYSNRFSFIELLNKENGGVSSARNAGLDLVSDSEYVTFIDPDDSILSKLYSKLYLE